MKNLPPLTPTKVVKPIGGWVCGNSQTWKKQAAKGQVIGKEKSAKHRSKTFEGIAKAMAEQWGKFIDDKRENMINNIVDTGGFFYYSMYYDGIPEKQIIADIVESYDVSIETATAAFKEILRQWKPEV